ncbi:response regulator [Alkaliphilus transvaalensis]|uniref:response regulator n=1 Tax=Alkaliphilus transvaalensis TaxID=114628 RepID=UPI00047B2FB4|nr:response regulator [Alkaliphilus transvaalensis]
MKLEYRILWFEDNESWFKTHKQVIENFLDDRGFVLNAVRYENDDKGIEEILKECDYDLILMDYNLTDANGDVIIERIREQQLYTEIIFYSQNGAQAIRDIIKERGVDGVYCSGRHIIDFEEKVTKVIETTIKKVQDLNNMRGLVMAEVSELDDVMLQIISNFLLAVSCEEKDKLIQEIFKVMKNSMKDNAKKLERFIGSNDIQNLINSRLFDSEKKRNVVSKIINIINEQNIMENYKEEVLIIRNVLAHVKEEIVDGKRVLRSKLPGFEEFIFDDQICVKIRKDLKKHNDLLKNINTTIQKRIQVLKDNQIGA